MIEACKQRLIDQVGDLTEHRVEGAAEFAEMVENATIPQSDFFAYLIPSGLRGNEPSSMSAAFVQGYSENLGVVLGFRSVSATADGKIAEIESKISEVVNALCGWSPSDGVETPGVFKLVSGRVTGFRDGVVFYQLEFSITRQMRILP